MESLDKISSCRKRRIMSRISLNQVESSERFYRIPKVFTDENSYYCTMRLESKFAYGLLKDRFELSIKNKWVDKEKNIYLIFTVKELEKVLGCKKDKVHQIKRELAQYGLLEEERQGLNKPNRIYVLNIDTMRTSEKPTSNEATDYENYFGWFKAGGEISNTLIAMPGTSLVDDLIFGDINLQEDFREEVDSIEFKKLINLLRQLEDNKSQDLDKNNEVGRLSK